MSSAQTGSIPTDEGWLLDFASRGGMSWTMEPTLQAGLGHGGPGDDLGNIRDEKIDPSKRSRLSVRLGRASSTSVKELRGWNHEAPGQTPR